jgi:hypothetical protein
MKNLFLSILVACSIVLFSCKEEPEVASTLSTTSDLLNIKTIGGYQSLSISSTKPWTASSSEKWCTLSDTVGTGNKSMVVQCEDNLSGINRQTNITINAGDQSKTVVVKQSGGTILLDENFSSNAKSWYIVENDTLSENIIDGYYKFRNSTKGNSYFAGSKSIITNYVGDYMISYKYKYIAGKNPFGLTFGKKDNENLYIMYIYPSGTYEITKRASKITTTIKSGYSLNITNDNSIILLKVGSLCTVYVNDVKTESFDFPTPFGSYVSFYLTPTTEVNVDSYKIVQF